VIVGVWWLIGSLAAGLAAATWWHRRFARLRRALADFIGREAPDITIRGHTPTGVTVEVLGVAADIDFASLARRRPTGRTDAEWFAEITDGLRRRAPQPNIPPLALVQDRILPLLRPIGYARLFDRYGSGQRMVWRHMDDGVAVTYVVTGLHQVTVVTEAAREAWTMSTEALHDLALVNLRAETSHMLSELDGPRRVYEHIDAFDATRLLVADMLVPADVNDAVFAIPEETVLMIAPRSEHETLAARARRRHASAVRPLSPLLYRLGPRGPIADVT
jgi:hypothetical protein